MRKDLLDAQKTFHGIDLFKLIAAILIVVLHAIETNDITANCFRYVLTRWCVPFFFICSGFFFCSGISRTNNKRAYFWAYEKRLLILFLFYGVILSFPIVLSDYLRLYPDASFLKLTLLIIRRILVIGNGAYWYLVALIISIAFLYLCCIRNWGKLLISCIILGFFLQIGYTSFQGIVNAVPIWHAINSLIYFVFSWDANFIMYGIPFCGLGWLIYQHSINIQLSTALWGAICCTFLRALEFLLPYICSSTFLQANTFSIFFIPQAVFFFFIAHHAKGLPRHSREMRQFSTFLYFSHWLVMYNILNPILTNTFNINVYTPSFIPYKVLLTIFICAILHYLLKKTNNKYILFLIGG